ncbi:uncharacterized protein MYCFIDRAFT_206858 [Pseudocercospora fijiensis CIRAD86]|uniref:Uncharacterized protein n=1 Tax=Pseudocercospora fijiensis (strain CIRAD86) TaxID=383855 RepID=M3A637_PSEFD|nr:uncharacterized protein MYCFIDRAFT_206858 [Pseudocercospora fijiensis CIRAD86]EME86579.1 hypothetical protein MYCFIDRAFT_206858 [Pseudocercospora fijiensis CIRAD86]
MNITIPLHIRIVVYAKKNFKNRYVRYSLALFQLSYREISATDSGRFYQAMNENLNLLLEELSCLNIIMLPSAVDHCLSEHLIDLWGRISYSSSCAWAAFRSTGTALSPRHLDAIHPHSMDGTLSIVAQYGRNPFGPMVDDCCPSKDSQARGEPLIDIGSDALSRVKSADTQAWRIYVPGEKGAKHLKKPEPRRNTKQRNRSVRSSASPIIVSAPPTSQTALIASRLAHAITAINSEFSWIAVGPSLIGKDKVFDIAALACSQACEYYLQKSSGVNDEALHRAALDNYDLAVSRLRIKLGSNTSRKDGLDFAAATSGALSTAASMIRVHDHRNKTIDGEEGYIHYDALSRYLVVDAAMTRAPSAIHRAIFHDIIRYKYFRACSLGTLDSAPEFPRKYQAYWDLMSPYSFGTRTEYWGRLQSSCQKIDARLPDLIQYVQKLRQGSDVSSFEVIGLSQHLLTLQDRAAEDVAKAIGKVVDTQDDCSILPKAFDFTGCCHWPFLVHYWPLANFAPFALCRRYFSPLLTCLWKSIGCSTAFLTSSQEHSHEHTTCNEGWVWAADPQIEGLQTDNLREWILDTLRNGIGVGFAQGWTAADLKQRAGLFAMTPTGLDDIWCCKQLRR